MHPHDGWPKATRIRSKGKRHAAGGARADSELRHPGTHLSVPPGAVRPSRGALCSIAAGGGRAPGVDQALADFVAGGGGLVRTEWSAYEAGACENAAGQPMLTTAASGAGVVVHVNHDLRYSEPEIAKQVLQMLVNATEFTAP